jgi:hypothetical protein
LLSDVALPDPRSGQSLERDGVSVALDVAAGRGRRIARRQFADVQFRTDRLPASPCRALRRAPGSTRKPCRRPGPGPRTELQGAGRGVPQVEHRRAALLDLNSYFLLVMNRDASLSVVDPSVSVGGITSTWRGSTSSNRRWTGSPQGQQAGVRVDADGGEVAVIDSEQFKLVDSVAPAANPVRVALQPDERLLWVGNNAQTAQQSGVTVIDTHSLKTLKHLHRGRPSRNRLQQGQPFRLRHQPRRRHPERHRYRQPDHRQTTQDRLAPAVGGVLATVRRGLRGRRQGRHGYGGGRSEPVGARVIKVKQGLGPMGFSADGRFGIVLNTLENQAAVIDAATDLVDP